jgi:hypothetical protein
MLKTSTPGSDEVFCLAVNDALDDILADSDDEEEEAAIVNKVLDEIGIEISGKVINSLFFSFL